MKYICVKLTVSCLYYSEEADLLARALGCRLLRTSVKEDVNVAAVFRHLATRCLAELREPREEYYPPIHGGLSPVTISKYTFNMQ